MNKYYFQNVARSERYFTATHLSHLLMANNFEGTKLFFKRFFQNEVVDGTEDFEVVTEVDLLRDPGKQDNEIKKLFHEYGRIAVPDLFVRWGKYAFIIEAKFFTLPNKSKLKNQVEEQRRAVNYILDKTAYADHKIMYAIIALEFKQKIEIEDTLTLTWKQIVDLFESQLTLPLSNDCKYSIKILKDAIERAQNELFPNSNTNWIRFKSFNELYGQWEQLIEAGYLYVGFSEGLSSYRVDLQHILMRNHYKVSTTKDNNKWIELKDLIAKYHNLKNQK